MKRKKKQRQAAASDVELGGDEAEVAAGGQTQVQPDASDALATRSMAVESAAIEEAAPEETELEQAMQELEELRDRYLRLAAEYDNHRKRIARERVEMRARVQAELVRTVLEALDDLGRVLDVDPATAAAADVIAGVELVERKLLRELENAGLERLGVDGDPFDPEHHEAVGAEPAPTAAQEGLISSVVQPGYRVGTVLVRPARVRVFVMPAPSDDGESEA